VVSNICRALHEGDGMTCADVDECAASNGGCDALVTCNNTVGGRTCGSCPGSHRGDGVNGCRLMSASCDIDRGGCDLKTACIADGGGGGGNTCGPCPGGRDCQILPATSSNAFNTLVS